MMHNKNSALTASANRSQRGFTLLEMVVVMAIIALGAAAVLPRLTVPYRSLKPVEVDFLEKQHARAIESGQVIRVLLQERRLIAQPGPDSLELAEQRELRIVRPQKSEYLNQQMVSTFYPDGTSLWSEFSLIRKDRLQDTVLFTVKTDPLHGEITYVAP